ncbi:MAG: hypothetical protein FOGNACKC_00879 [Anaerolineae bacterium]|nr:hypothetical protein [Anaerolineae bacterium]
MADKKLAHQPDYTDINPANWRDYPDVLTDSWWDFPSRDRTGGHKLVYHGNFIPQIPYQLMMRYSRAGEIVLDPFLGAGTTAIEALRLGRRCLGIEIQPGMVDYVRDQIPADKLDKDIRTVMGDSTSIHTWRRVTEELVAMGAESAQLAILHPPYADIIKFSSVNGDLSALGDSDEFVTAFAKVVGGVWRVLDNGRFAGLVIGDIYKNGETVPLGFMCMELMRRVGFKLRGIAVKNINGNEVGKGRTANLWRYRALAGGYLIFKHEYVVIFQKPK